MRSKLAILVLIPCAVAVAPAWGQSNPSVDQIIKSLTPAGDVSGAATRGLRLGPAPAGSPVSNPPVTQASSRSVQPGKGTVAPSATAAPSVNMTVNFATGSAELTPQAVDALDRLGTALSDETLATYRFRVEGHTDTVGTHEYNYQLSRRRAIAVVDYINAKFSVAATRLEPVGMGSDRPVVPTADQVAEARNRRVQVVNLGS